MPPTAPGSSDWTAIVDVLNRYATALDERRWELLDEVFHENCHMDFVAWQADSRREAVAHIRSFLGGCGPSQHLLGNYEIEISGDEATSRVYVRAFHLGRDERQRTSYEMGGEYRDRLERGAEGWRIVERLGRARWQQGDPSILGPDRDRVPT